MPRERARATRRSSSTTARPTARVDARARALSRSARLIEQENLGLAAGWNARHARRDRALRPDPERRRLADRRLARRGSSTFADAHPEAAVVGPRLLNPDGSLQRSVRGFPTLWRLATEYFFLRKLAPRLAAAQRVLRGRLRARRGARGRGRDGRLHARAPRGDRRRSAGSTSRSSSSARRPTGATASRRPAGRCSSSPAPSACTSAARRTAGGMFRENAARASALSREAPRRARRRAGAAAAAAGRCGCAARLFRGERGRMYRDAARWLGSGACRELLER